jgi:hypothetical protein
MAVSYLGTFSCLVWLFVSAAAEEADGPQFQQKYATTTNNIGRRDLVLKAIDSGIIKRGMTLTEIQRLFGETNVFIFNDDNGRVYRSVVWFTLAPRQPKPSNPHAAVRAVAPTGWYLDLEFQGKQLNRYSLSNVHK